MFDHERKIFREMHTDTSECQCASCQTYRVLKKSLGESHIPRERTGGVAWLIVATLLVDILAHMKNDDQRGRAVAFLNNRLSEQRRRLANEKPDSPLRKN